jgi:hypothetical protein
LSFALTPDTTFDRMTAVVSGAPIAASLNRTGTQADINLAEDLLLSAGQTLEISFS